MALMPALLALASSACSDTRTAYDTYVACDAQVAEAVSVKGLLSCYTEDQHDLLRSKAERSDAWLAQFQGSRPIIKRLHEEQLLDVEGESILAIVGHTKFGQPAAINVLMRREGRRWKIDMEESLAKGAVQDDVRPIQVSLGPAAGEEWYPGELAGSIRNRKDSKCTLSIAQVFRAPEISITTDCQRLAEPGTYSIEDLTPAGEVATASIPIHFFDETHTWLGRVGNGVLTIAESGNGVVSGEFTFDMANPRRQLSIIGNFQNIPFIPGG